MSEPNGTVGPVGSSPGRGGDEQKSLADTIKDNVGLLLVAFIGAANFIGISTGEIPNILRNEERDTNFAATLIALAILAGVMSAVLGKDKILSSWWYVPAILFLAATYFLVLAGIQIPESTAPYEAFYYVVAVLSGITVLIAIPAVLILKRRYTRPVNARLFALLLAVFLTVIATYAGLRVETQSQSTSNEPRLVSASIARTGDTYFLTATVNASRLAAGNVVQMAVYAYNKPKNAPEAAPPSAEPECLRTKQCSLTYCYDANDCEVVSDSFSQPDPNGNVNSKVTIPIPARAYYLVITGVINSEKSRCRGGPIGKGNRSCLTSTVTLNVPPDP